MDDMDPDAMPFSLVDVDRAIILFGLIRNHSNNNEALKADQLFGPEG